MEGGEPLEEQGNGGGGPSATGRASSAHFGELYQLFSELHALGGLERASRLEALRARDPSLARELDELLCAEETGAGLFETPVLGGEVDLAAVLSSAEEERKVPQRMGGYRVLSVLGEGGMGVVYRAEQEHPRRTVALKVLKGGFATPKRLRRFEHEAEILGRLQHPGIAQVFEAGAADAGEGLRPFIAMELVEGVDLRTHAQSRALSVRERLALLVEICEAVAHAHQKGVVHRDLKLENVLVDAAGRPKVLDFGVARMIREDSSLATLHTQEGTLLGTPWTMSPEQLAGDPDAADTRSDVYALGVIGYELFAGRPPYELTGKPLAEVARIIRDEEPIRLEKEARGLPADLATVIGKCLEKDPARRYASASELAGDLARVLADEPISARPPSGIYLLRKFVRRNRGLSAGLATAALALLLSAIVFAVQAVRLARQRDRALGAETQAENALAEAGRERDKLAASFQFLKEMLRSVDARRSGAEVRVVDLLERGSRLLAGRFPGEPIVESELRRSLGHAWRSVGMLEQALAEMRAALELVEASADTANAANLARNDLALLLMDLGRFNEAEPLYWTALEHQRVTLGPRALDTLATQKNLSRALFRRGDFQQAEEFFREVLGAAEELEKSATGEELVGTQRLVLDARYELAHLLFEKGELAEARALVESALAEARTTLGERDPDYVLAGMAHLSQLEGAMGEPEKAVLHARENLGSLSEELSAGQPTLTSAKHHLGMALVRAGRAEEGERILREAFEGRRELLGPKHLSTVITATELAEALVALERFAEAETLLRETLAGLDRALPPGNWMPDAANAVLGKCLMRMGELEEAEERLEQSHAGLQQKLGPTGWRTRRAVEPLIELHEKRGNHARAEELRRVVRSPEGVLQEPGE